MIEFHTRLSTWIAVVIFLASAFTALPTFHNLIITAMQIPLLFILIVISHEEGKAKK